MSEDACQSAALSGEVRVLYSSRFVYNCPKNLKALLLQRRCPAANLVPACSARTSQQCGQLPDWPITDTARMARRGSKRDWEEAAALAHAPGGPALRAKQAVSLGSLHPETESQRFRAISRDTTKAQAAPGWCAGNYCLAVNQICDTGWERVGL